MDLKGKNVLVTGASSGIGASFAHLLAAKGSNILLVARSKDKLESIAKELQDKHQITTWVYPKDLSQLNASQELYQQLKKDQVEVDILINNAGFGKWGKFESFSLKEYTDMIQLNVTALMELSYLFLEDFKQKTEAGILNVGSTASLVPVPYSAVYAATKSFVLSLTEGLVGELEGSNITVSCLCPSGTASNFATVANSNNTADYSNEDLLSSDEVAQIGLDTFLAGKHYVVTGRKSMSILTKILSRKRVIKMVAAYWKKRLNLE